ncbi:MAG: tetratricopeptide repeat protein [Saprospiraceae bacterium]|uniref:histidine kinase n=1 Tax=Candidatus Defluviibacterium haderslevense TaxID=2981993 RepID=A0A9D7XF03_9BACT|nr:tetratricopeptide repeat protein [Candidatus Defluviibacterium haderslevense]
MRTLFIYILIFHIFFLSSIQAQRTIQEKLDSLTKISDTCSDFQKKIQLLNKITFGYYGIDNAKGIEFGTRALELAQQIDFKEGIADAYNGLATNYMNTIEKQKALEYFQKAFDINTEINNLKGQANNLGNIGMYYYDVGEFSTSLDFLFRSIKIFELLNDKTGIANQLGAIGNVYSDQKNFIKAIYYDSLALLKFQELGDLDGSASNLGNIGNLYNDLNEPDIAIKYFKLAIDNYRQLNIESGIGRNLLNMSTAYNAKHNYKKSEELLKEAIAIFKNQNDQYALTYGYGNLGNCYLLNYIHHRDLDSNLLLIPGNPKVHLKFAIQYLELGIKMSKEINVLPSIIVFSNQLSDAYNYSGDYINALKYYKLYATSKDSVFSIESKENIEKLTTAREVELKNKQIEINRLEVLKKRNERIYFIFGIILLLLILVFIYRNFTNQKKSNIALSLLNNKINETNTALANKNEVLSSTLTELKETQEQLIETEKQKENAILRSRISQDIHDDISSGLTKISWLTEMVKAKSNESNTNIDYGLIDKINSASKETVSKLGEIIWSTNPDRDNLESLLAYIRNYVTKFLEDTDLQYTIDFPDDLLKTSINPELRRNLFLVLKEALNNIIKYAKAKNITISLQLENQSYKLLVEDDGIGIEQGIINGGGNGLINMRKRMAAIHGKVNIESIIQQGTRIYFSGYFY